ncbi:MAG: hypothetical protein O3A92_13280 [Verrucomicrobia bacterium]|nr:hypothetical protein [Verrucomicrobiota bacterium]
MRVGFGFALNLASIDHNVRFSDFGLIQTREDYRHDWTDTFELGGVIPPLATPRAPYEGSYDGPGPLINNTPDDRNSVAVLLNTDTATFTNRVRASFHGALTTFSFGPTLTYDRQGLSVRASGGPTVSILDWSSSQDELLSLQETSGGTVGGTSTYRTWIDDSSGLKFIPGLFAQVEVLWQYDEDWTLSGFTRLDSATSREVNPGGSSFAIDSSGYTVGLQVGRAF